jgi:hypothetical protein
MREPSRRAASVCAAVCFAVARICTAQGTEGHDEKARCLDAADQGQSQRDDGKYRAARESFVVCSRDVCPNIVAQSCMRWLREVDEDAPTVVAGAKDEQGVDLTEVHVFFDGEPFTSQLDGRPLAADAGEHVFRFERDTGSSAERRVVLRAGEKARIVTVVLPSAAGAVSVSARAAEPIARRDAPMTPRFVAVAALAIGALAAAGTGAYFVVESNQEKDDAVALRGNRPAYACSGATAMPACLALGQTVSEQHQDADVATALFVGAGALAAGAALLWVSWPKSSEAAPGPTAWIEPTERGATVRFAGSFQ